MRFALGLAGVFALVLLSLHVASATYPSDLPPTPIPRATAQPSASTDTTPAPRGRRATPVPSPTGSGAPNASGSPTPAPPQFTTLDGTWEVELQSKAKTLYSHWSLRQSGSGGNDITGVWDRGGKPPKRAALSGTFDGRLFKFTVSDGGADYTFTGYVENFTDIVGMMNDGKGDVPFTAQHRKKERAIDQFTPGVGPNPVGIPR